MTNKQTFSGFSQFVSSRYTRSRSEIGFMSLPTFIEWFFGWASHMRIDFRKGCEICGDAPKVLACDGTKIGIGFKSMFVAPIETPDAEEPSIEVQANRRLDRCFIHSRGNNTDEREARKQLKITCLGVINGKVPHDQTLLARLLPEAAVPAYQQMLNPDTQKDLRVEYARIFLVLSYDSSLDTVIPYSVSESCIEVCELAQTDCLTLENLQKFTWNLQFYSPEFFNLIQSSATHLVFRPLTFSCCYDTVPLS